MKTLAQALAEEEKRTKELFAGRRAYFDRLLESSKDVPPFEPDPSSNDKFGTKPAHNTNWMTARTRIRAALQSGNVTLYGIVCDHCRTELINHAPGIRLMSSPPQKWIACPGCGWMGAVECSFPEGGVFK